MKKVMELVIVILFGTTLLGCQQGVTDVGNPTISAKPPQNSPDTVNPGPTVGQLIGGYSTPTPVSASPAPGGSPSPTSTPALPTCKTDARQDPSIAVTSTPTQIVLNHFLNYGSATENILATYDSRTGAIAFDVSDAAIAITSCTGSASASGDTITVSLQCKAAVSSEPDCKVTYQK